MDLLTLSHRVTILRLLTERLPLTGDAKMNGKTYYTGYNLGWDAAGRYITGTKADRRKARGYLDRTMDSYNPLARGYADGFVHRAEQRIEAIRAGLAPRTVSPARLGYVVNRAVGN
jgi:hypothetical protein